LIFSQNKLFSKQMRVWLLSAICFALPMKASFVYVLSGLLLLVWLAEGGIAEKIKNILRSRVCLAFLAYYLVFLLAMLWTEDATTGWRMVERQKPFLLFLLYWSSAEPEYRERYISAFIAGLIVCAVLAHYNLMQLYWFPDWPRGVRVFKSIGDTAPFVDRIMYAPILALGAYFSLHRAVFSISMSSRLCAIGITSLLLSNLSFSGGRAGMVMFIVLCIALVFQRIAARRKALVICAVFLPLFFFSAYNTSGFVAERIDNAIADIRVFDKNPNTSVGQRLVYWTTSFQLFIRNPVIGVGSGDFQKEYAKIKPERWQATPDSYNPHNQFLMTAALTGLIGLMLLLFIFYSAAVSGNDARTKTVLIGFAAVCMFESYFWRSNTALTFSAILAALLVNARSESKA
jgi:O-antigen ligase